MIAYFFKQNKPIVKLVLVVLLIFFYWIKVISTGIEQYTWNYVGLLSINFLFLLFCFFLFTITVSHFQIQRGNSYYALFFVLFTSFILPELIQTYEIIAFTLLSLGVVKLLKTIDYQSCTALFFEASFYIFLSSLIYPPSVYLLIIVMVASVAFVSPKWQYFVVPIFSISSIVILVESYFLITQNTTVGLSFFLPQLQFSLNDFTNKETFFLLSVWFFCFLLCVYQIIQVRRVRSLYHKQLALFFLLFLVLSFVSHWLTESTVSGLWLLSFWPICIYVGDFLSQVKKRFWFLLFFWSIISFTLINFLFPLL